MLVPPTVTDTRYFSITGAPDNIESSLTEGDACGQASCGERALAADNDHRVDQPITLASADEAPLERCRDGYLYWNSTRKIMPIDYWQSLANHEGQEMQAETDKRKTDKRNIATSFGGWFSIVNGSSQEREACIKDGETKRRYWVDLKNGADCLSEAHKQLDSASRCMAFTFAIEGGIPNGVEFTRARRRVRQLRAQLENELAPLVQLLLAAKFGHARLGRTKLSSVGELQPSMCRLVQHRHLQSAHFTPVAPGQANLS